MIGNIEKGRLAVRRMTKATPDDKKGGRRALFRGGL